MSTPNPVPTQPLTLLQKLQVLPQLVSTITTIVINSLGQINNSIASAGLPALSAQTLAVVTKTAEDAVTLLGDDIGLIGNVVPLATNFATGVQGLITQLHAQAAAAQSALVPPAA